MSELFGFMNWRHFCHTEDVKNNRSSGLNILGLFTYLFADLKMIVDNLIVLVFVFLKTILDKILTYIKFESFKQLLRKFLAYELKILHLLTLSIWGKEIDSG